MRVPGGFPEAFAGLEELVGGISSGEVRGDALGREAGRWLREDAGGSLTLCKAAIFAMRHEAAARDMDGDAEGASAALRALDAVDRAIDPPEEADAPAPKMPVPARVPEELRKRAPGVRGFRLGRVEILAEPKPTGWRLSVSHPERWPTWEELMLARGVTRDTRLTFAAVIPAACAPADGRGFVVDLMEAGVRKVGGPDR